MHDDKGNPRIGFIRSIDLVRGELSIWRVSSSTAELSDVVEILKSFKPAGQELIWVRGVKAKELRDLLPSTPLCAIDDTDCGSTGRHKAHGVLAGCKQLGFSDLTKPDESPAFLAVRRALLEIFGRNKCWAG
jgi:hypothetical protein